MRVSVKGRYALAAMIEIARNSMGKENITVSHIAESLGISKIYLEQIFAGLKKSGLVLSSKGPKGGYQLARPLSKITAWDILEALETTFSESAESTVAESAPDIEMSMDTLVFQPLDQAIQQRLSSVTIQNLLDEAEKIRTTQSFMLNM